MRDLLKNHFYDLLVFKGNYRETLKDSVVLAMEKKYAI